MVKIVESQSFQEDRINLLSEFEHFHLWMEMEHEFSIWYSRSNKPFKELSEILWDGKRIFYRFCREPKAIWLICITKN